jgi:hypothetical protein
MPQVVVTAQGFRSAPMRFPADWRRYGGLSLGFLLVFLHAACSEKESGRVIFRDNQASVLLKTVPTSGLFQSHTAFEVLVREDRAPAKIVLSGGRLSVARLSAARLASGKLAVTTSWSLAVEVTPDVWLTRNLNDTGPVDPRLREALVWLASNDACLTEGRVRAAVALARMRAPEAGELLQTLEKLPLLTPNEKELVDEGRRAAGKESTP